MGSAGTVAGIRAAAPERSRGHRTLHPYAHTVQTRGTVLLMNDFGEEVNITDAMVLSKLLASSLCRISILTCTPAALREEMGSAQSKRP